MNIGYRRYSGPAFLDATKIKSTIGAYLEKRVALINALKNRGNTVTIINTGDDYSKFDIIIVEFGSTNYLFHRKDIDFSEQILKTGKAIFFLDDPDMMPKGLTCPVWVNADEKLCSQKWGIDAYYFPISGLQNMRVPKYVHNNKIVYFGRATGGRERFLKQYMTLIPELEIYGEQRNFQEIIPKTPPTEDERSKFYSNFMACLAVNDRIHKNLKWHTGRKYDAILSGCPAIDENINMFDIAKKMKDPKFRMDYIERQQEEIFEMEKVCKNLFTAFNM